MATTCNVLMPVPIDAGIARRLMPIAHQLRRDGRPTWRQAAMGGTRRVDARARVGRGKEEAVCGGRGMSGVQWGSVQLYSSTML